ncbi:hypothetical protein KAT92_06600 [Candidatus Babeliales bacterium]|nr:hypothetical protein [Candidatus Babeliales bacterium]
MKTLDVSSYEVKLLFGYWRFVNHTDKIATIGFKERKKLLKYKGNILATEAALNICKARYASIYEATK